MPLNLDDPKIKAAADSVLKEIGLSNIEDLAGENDEILQLFADKVNMIARRQQKITVKRAGEIAGKHVQEIAGAFTPVEQTQKSLEVLGIPSSFLESSFLGRGLTGLASAPIAASNLLSGLSQSIQQRLSDVVLGKGLSPQERITRGLYAGTGDILPSVEQFGQALGRGENVAETGIPAGIDIAATFLGPKIASRLARTKPQPRIIEPELPGGIIGEIQPETTAPANVDLSVFQNNPIFRKLKEVELEEKAGRVPTKGGQQVETPALRAPATRPPGEYKYNKNYIIRGNNLADLQKLISEKEVGTGQPFLTDRPSPAFIKALEQYDEMSPVEIQKAKFSPTPPTETGGITGKIPSQKLKPAKVDLSNIELEQMAEAVDRIAPSGTDAASRFTTVATSESLQPKTPGWRVNLFYALNRFGRFAKTPEAQNIMNGIRAVYRNTPLRIGWARSLARKYGFTSKFTDTNPLERLSPEEKVNAWAVRRGEAQPITPNVERAVKWWDEMAEKSFAEIQKVFPDIKKRKNYIPDKVQPELLDQFYNDVETMREHVRQIAVELDSEKGVKTPDQLSEQRIAEIFDKHFDPSNFPEWVQETIADAPKKFGQSTGAALARLLRVINEEYWNPYGSIDFRWLDAIPERFKDKDFARVTWNYVNGYARRLSEAEQFGANGEKALGWINEVRRKSPKEAEFIEGVLKRFLHTDKSRFLGSRQLEAAARFNVAWNYLTKIVFNVKTNAQQLLQTGASSGIEVGFWNQLRANYRHLIENDPELLRLIDESGILDTDAFSIHTGYETPKMKAFHTLGSAFGEENLLNKRLALAQYYVQMKTLWNLAHNQSKLPFKWAKQGRAKWAQETLAEKGLDWTKPLEHDDVLTALYHDATKSQLQPDVLTEPGWWTNPHLRPGLALKRAPWKQFLFIKDLITKEFKKNNPLPFLRAMIAGGVGGELFQALTNYYYSALKGETVYREEDTLLKRFINDLAAFWSGGWLTDLLATQTKDKNFQEAAKFLRRSVTPVVVGIGGTDLYGTRAFEEDTPTDERVARILQWLGSNVFGATLGAASQRLKTPQQKLGTILYKRGNVVERAAKAGKSRPFLGTGLPLFTPDQQQIIDNWNKHHQPHLWIVTTNDQKTYDTQASLEDYWIAKINKEPSSLKKQIKYETGVAP